MSNETLGSMIDRLLTADLKLWNIQENLYRIRKMSFDEFKKEFIETEEGNKLLWETFKKATDLNCQRAELVDGVDMKFVELIKAAMSGEELDNGKFIQRKFKTY